MTRSRGSHLAALDPRVVVLTWAIAAAAVAGALAQSAVELWDRHR